MLVHELMKASLAMNWQNNVVCLVFLVIMLAVNHVNAAEHANSAQSLTVLDYLIDKDGKYTGPTVEDKIALMDTDKNGFADVMEVRSYLQLTHGENYQKDLLDKWAASANGKSCSTPFAKELYK